MLGTPLLLEKNWKKWLRMKRDEFVSAMRDQTDLDSVDVPDQMAWMFLREAFERTTAQRRQWPSYQATWDLEFPAREASMVLPDDVNEIASLRTSLRLNLVDFNFAEESYGDRFGKPRLYSVWGSELFLWPKPSQDETVSIRGWRKPDYLWLADPAMEADLDERLHLCLLHYAVSLVYAQQEDMELENQYMRRWSQTVEDAASDVDRPPTYRPIVLNGGEDQGIQAPTLSMRYGFDAL